MTDYERKRIFGLARELGMNSEELHILVNGVTGVTSIKDLNKSQTYSVIQELNNRINMSGRTAPRKPKAKKEEVIVPGMITPNQKKYCWSMMYRLCELEPKKATEGERMCGAIGKILGVTAVPEDPFKWVTFEQGRDLIEGLKRYVYSAEKKAIREGRLK
ncbi:MAG: regulatory protein GemA [Oscillospiraceae bacterium]|nr:regulatory protein GemA [Oscillospiraceae bacterium]